MKIQKMWLMPFSEVKYGTVFEWSGLIFMKGYIEGKPLAIELDEGTAEYDIKPDSEVTVYQNAKVVLI